MATHLVTGAGSGIGAAVARALHERGDELVLLARNAERAAYLSEQLPGARTLVADLADIDAVEQLTGLPERLDSLLNVAGILELEPLAQLTTAHLRDQLDVNLVAPAVLTRACLPALRAARGTVVFVNSGAGVSAGPTWSAYGASKYGLRGVADALRAEEAESGVRVTSVFVSRTATPMQEKVHAQEGRSYDPAQWLRPEVVAATLLHVLDQPVDTAIPELTIRPMPAAPVTDP